MLKVNCYHTSYRVGQRVLLVQFTFSCPGSDIKPVALEEVIALSRMHPRYVYALRLVTNTVTVDSVVHHSLYEEGCTAAGTCSSSGQLLIAHHQYPTYRTDAYYKPRWQVYQLDLSWQGKYTYTDWEDASWVLRHVDKIRYRTLRNKIHALAPSQPR